MCTFTNSVIRNFCLSCFSFIPFLYHRQPALRIFPNLHSRTTPLFGTMTTQNCNPVEFVSAGPVQLCNSHGVFPANQSIPFCSVFSGCFSAICHNNPHFCMDMSTFIRVLVSPLLIFLFFPYQNQTPQNGKKFFPDRTRAQFNEHIIFPKNMDF